MNEPSAVSPTDVTQFLSFVVGGEEFGIEILEVRELIAFSPVSRVPSAPGCIRGVVNLRGKVVPVVDLAARFGEVPGPISKWSCIVVLETGAQGLIGLLADSVKEV